MADMKFVSTNASIPFRCQKCGKCCKNLKDSLMLESIDIFYLTKSLRRHDSSITCTDDMLERYTHVAAIERGFPIYQANTVGVDAACVFLENDRCRIYDARPLVCRMFPFGIAPGEKGRDFRFYLVMDQSHHFGAGQVIVKDWLTSPTVKTVGFSRASARAFKPAWSSPCCHEDSISALTSQYLARVRCIADTDIVIWEGSLRTNVFMRRGSLLTT